MANLAREEEKRDELQDRLVSILNAIDHEYDPHVLSDLFYLKLKLVNQLDEQELVVHELVKADILVNFFGGAR